MIDLTLNYYSEIDMFHLIVFTYYGNNYNFHRISYYNYLSLINQSIMLV